MGRLIDDLAEVEDNDTPLWFSGEIDRHTGKVINDQAT
jgi:predicted aconitase with swiveling domain